MLLFPQETNSLFSSKLTKIKFDFGVPPENLYYRQETRNQERIWEIYANHTTIGTSLRLNET